MPLQIAIVTPDQEARNTTCEEIVVPGLAGDLGLLPGHIPLISALRPGVLTLVESGKKSVYAVGSGFVEVSNDRVSILTETCDAPGDIDVDASRKDLADAQKHLAELGPNDSRFWEFERSASLAQAKIDAAARR